MHAHALSGIMMKAAKPAIDPRQAVAEEIAQTIARVNGDEVVRAGEEAARIFAKFRDSEMTEEEIREEIIRAAVKRHMPLDTGVQSRSSKT
jgi:hypothetical protein